MTPAIKAQKELFVSCLLLPHNRNMSWQTTYTARMKLPEIHRSERNYYHVKQDEQETMKLPEITVRREIIVRVSTELKGFV